MPIYMRHEIDVKPFERGTDARRAGKVGPFLRVRVGRIPTGDTFDGSFEVIEAVFLHD